MGEHSCGCGHDHGEGEHETPMTLEDLLGVSERLSPEERVAEGQAFLNHALSSMEAHLDEEESVFEPLMHLAVSAQWYDVFSDFDDRVQAWLQQRPTWQGVRAALEVWRAQARLDHLFAAAEGDSAQVAAGEWHELVRGALAAAEQHPRAFFPLCEWAYYHVAPNDFAPFVLALLPALPETLARVYRPDLLRMGFMASMFQAVDDGLSAAAAEKILTAGEENMGLRFARHAYQRLQGQGEAVSAEVLARPQSWGEPSPLLTLLSDFARYLVVERGWPWLRAEMARVALLHYQLGRPALLYAQEKRRRQARKPAVRWVGAPSLLVELRSLETAVQPLAIDDWPRGHTLCALLQAVHPWFDFLRAQGLLPSPSPRWVAEQAWVGRRCAEALASATRILCDRKMFRELLPEIQAQTQAEGAP